MLFIPVSGVKKTNTEELEASTVVISVYNSRKRMTPS